MRVRGKSIPTALILGAGATRGAIRHVLVKRNRIRPPLNSDFFKIAETYARARGTNSAEAKQLRRLKTLFKNDLPATWPPPMETAFSLLYTAKDFPEIYTSRPGPKPDPGERQELEDFLSLMFGILNVVDRNSEGETGYDCLAGILEPGDTIITLNYDTAMDSALVRLGWNPATGYGLGGSPGKCKWKPVSAHSRNGVDGISLLKLHGSMNWWVRGSVGELANVFTSKPVTITPPRSNTLNGKMRQIIPPIYGKVFAHEHWRRLWRRAFEALCETELLVVIGCSIVDTDYHLQALLRRAAKERKKHHNKLKEAILVDRARVRRRWQRVLRGTVGTYTAYNNFRKFLCKGVTT